MRPLDTDFRLRMRARLRQSALDNGLDGHLLCSPANVAYACGYYFRVSERPVALWIPVEGEEILFVPALERENAEAATIADLRCYDEYPGLVHPVIWMLEEIGRKSISIDFLNALLLPAARDRSQRLFLRDFAMEQRMAKEPEEIALIRAAAGYADRVLDRLLETGADLLAQGGSEHDLIEEATGHVRAQLMADYRDVFARTPLAITASLHSGPRAALPHGALTNRRPQPGEVLIAGIGAQLGGYHAQSGATFTIGAPSAEQRRMLRVLADAGAATAAALVPGAVCAQVNEASTRIISDAGLADAIRHRAGHAMGVAGHEPPWLAPGDRTPLAPGMVLTSSPGIYRPGLDGYRCIDTMIVTETRPETASAFLRRTPMDARVIAA